jgi:catechol 2,3-dioxygenase-like lactoylglutathione lyase family enzyme
MQRVIEKLVNDFERGKLSRRRLVSVIAALAAGAQTAPGATPFKAVNINHVTSRVPDLQRASRFYQDVFGMTLQQHSASLHLLGVGKSVWGLETGKEKTAVVDHVSLGIENFRQDEAVAKLKKLGLVSEVAKESLKFRDPQGLTVQLNLPDYPGYLP